MCFMLDQEVLLNMILGLAPDGAAKEINDDTNIVEDLQYDSLAMVELLNEIEEKFGVDFTELPDFLERFECVGDIWDGIQTLLNVAQ